MNISLIAERVSSYHHDKIGRLRIITATAHTFLLMLMLAFAAQGIPYLAAHSSHVISSVHWGYWLSGGGLVIFFAAVLWSLFRKS